jgi:hypothetical protein
MCRIYKIMRLVCSAKAQSLAAALGVTKAIAVASMSSKLIESSIIVAIYTFSWTYFEREVI